jgi:hypothetical protein
VDFKRQGPKPSLGFPSGDGPHPAVVVDWYPKIQAERSQGVWVGANLAHKDEGKLDAKHLAFMDLDEISFALERFNNERSWYNVTLSREAVRDVLEDNSWYRQYIPREELAFIDFRRVRR